MKEQLKEWTKKKIGRRRFKHLMEKIKEIENKRRGELRKKYKEKTLHLERQREEELKKKMEIVPSGLEDYSDCSIFHREKIENMLPEKTEIKLIGKVKTDEDENAVLR